MAAQDQQYLPTDLPKEISAHLRPQEEYDQSSGIKTLLAWHAPGRPFRKRPREYYMSSLLIMLLIETILFLFSQYLLMLVVLSLVFVTFALRMVAPHDFRYRITTQGITVEDYSFLWQELYDFYFKHRDGVDVLHVRTRALLPGELTITLGEMHKEHVKAVLLPYLPYREAIRKTFMEKSGDWLSKTFPLERPQPPHKVAS